MRLKITGWIVTLMLALSVLAAPLDADAQPPGKVARIGFLGGASPETAAGLPEAFRQGLREVGYIEGQNIAIEWRFAAGRFERFPEFAAELVRLKVDVIVAAITPAALAAKAASGAMPIVMAAVDDPVGSGLVASLARPGGNVTGLSSVGPELTTKQLQLLKEAVPKASRVAVLANPANPAQALLLRDAEMAARSLGVELQILKTRGPEEFEGAFSAMIRERARALLVLWDPMFFVHRGWLADLAAKNRLPAMYAFREFADVGGLMAYAAILRHNYERAAAYVDKILKGAKPADLPVEQPTRYELLINLKTAKTLGLTIPQSILIRADHVIQ